MSDPSSTVEDEAMRPEEIEDLTAARESLCRRRGELARAVAGDPHAPVETIEALTTILVAIEAVDRALNEAGHPYMSDRLRVEADNHSTPQPGR
jgi:hypothetical protein